MDIVEYFVHMPNANKSKERWSSRTGVVLAVASGAIGLGNFLRFPGQAAQNGGGAFMLPYIISFVILGIPVVLTEWIMGRRGSKYGHSAPFIFKNYLKGIPLLLSGTIGIAVPLLIYIYYVFIEAWCLAYAYGFMTGGISLDGTSAEVVQQAGEYFITLTGAGANGDSFKGPILLFSLVCFFINFYIVNRGLSNGLELLSKFAIPLMGVFSMMILFRVLSLDNISLGLGKMWNPDWKALLHADVWLAAAGQIFFSLSAGFGIALVFSSFLTRKDDVNLSSISSASINEFAEVAFGGMITIPVAFLFLGDSISSFGTFGMGFIALPSVFNMMPAGNFFGGLWFFILFLAALTSSITMLQPVVIFLEEAFAFSRRLSVLSLFAFTIVLFLPIVYFNYDFTALDTADFWAGTILIYILATIQIFIFVKKIGTSQGIADGNEGSSVHLPNFVAIVIKYITPSFLVILFVTFLYQEMPKYIDKMNPALMKSRALPGEELAAETRAYISLGVFLGLLAVFSFISWVVHMGLKRQKE